MTTNRRNVLKRLRICCKQMVNNRQFHLTNNLQGRLEETIERLPNHALGRILDRHNRHITGSVLDEPKYVSDRRLGLQNSRLTKMLQRRCLRIGTNGTQETNGQRTLKCKAARHDLAKNPCRLISLKWTRVIFLDRSQNLCFTLRTIEQCIPTLTGGQLYFSHTTGTVSSRVY